MLLGYSIIAVPTGIVSAEMFRTARDRDDRRCPACGRAGHDVDARYCRLCAAALDPETS